MDRTNLSIASVAGMRKELNLDIDNRYVRIFEENKTKWRQGKPLLSSELTPTRVEHHLTRLLPHLYHIPTPLHLPRPLGRPQAPPGPHHPPLGLRHDRDGLRGRLGRSGGSARHPWNLRGWVLP